MSRAVRFSIVLSLIGCLSFIAAGVASAQEVEGGCEASVNARAPSTLTEEDPLVLEGERTVRVRGQAPASAQAGATETVVNVMLFGGGIPLETIEGEGTRWGGIAEVPGFLETLAPGIYRVEAEGSGPGWECTASGYIELEGGPLSVATGVGAVLGGLGIAMTLGARGRGSDVPDRSVVSKRAGVLDREAVVRPARARTLVADLAYLVVLALLFFSAYEEVPDLGDSLFLAISAAGGGTGFWVRGRVVRGFLGGLFLGVGVALLLHQFDIWTLDLMEGLVFPLAVAVVSAVRAWVGSAYQAIPPAAPVREPETVPAGTPSSSTSATPPA
jgi:hypothetical protein